MFKQKKNKKKLNRKQLKEDNSIDIEQQKRTIWYMLVHDHK